MTRFYSPKKAFAHYAMVFRCLLLDISQGDERIFRQSLQQAKQNLQKAFGTLTTGFASDDSESLGLARDVHKLAGDLVNGMSQKLAKDRRDSRQSKSR